MKRSLILMVVLSVVTFGIYPLFWIISVKSDMEAEGAEVPSSLLLFIPIANLYYLAKWCGGFERLTRGRTSPWVAFLLLVGLGMIGMLILQYEINKTVDEPVPPRAAGPYQRVPHT